MTKVTTLVLMLCLTLSGALCYASGLARTENKKGKDGISMDIEYIYVYQLIWDCDKDETITCQSDLDGFEYGVKKSVAITSTVDEPIIGNTDKITFRVSDSFEIAGPFQVESGAEFTIIRQDCPNND